MIKNLASGVLLLAFLAATSIASTFYLHDSVSRSAEISSDALITGRWAAGFEHVFGETLPVYEGSRNLWGGIDFALFNQGRKGVVAGSDGWLFTDEEFSCPPHYRDNFSANMDFVAGTAKHLAEKNIALQVLLIPAKLRVYQDKAGGHAVPSCRAHLYDETLAGLKDRGIAVVPVLDSMLAARDKEQLFLRTDTHWTPRGARLAANMFAEKIGPVSGLGIDSKAYNTAMTGQQPHRGDLMRYLPGVENAVIRPDARDVAVTGEAQGGDLFGDSLPQVTLVGTSYSANPLWNFEGFLKQALQADVLNMADEGLGPFTVMDKYLAGTALDQTPPKLLIWEIPERYVILPHTLASDNTKANTAKVF